MREMKRNILIIMPEEEFNRLGEEIIKSVAVADNATAVCFL